jgi:hypothetical protein
MNTVSAARPGVRRRRPWLDRLGWLISLVPVLIVLTSARWKLTHDPSYVREFARIGWQITALPILASLQLAALVLYLIPPTAVLGVVLLTGYLGGAIASYVRIGEWSPPLVPFTTAVLAWLGLWLRDRRLRALLPIRWRGPEEAS